MPWVRQLPATTLRGTQHNSRQGRGRETEGGAARRASKSNSGADLHADIAGGGSEKSTASKGKEKNPSREAICVRGRQGRRGISAGLLTHGGGPADPGGIHGLGEIQLWIAPQWGDRWQRSVAETVAGTGGHARTALQRAEWESQAPIVAHDGHITHRSQIALREHIEIHPLPEGDTTERPALDRLRQDTEED